MRSHLLLAALITVAINADASGLQYVRQADWRATWDASIEASHSLAGVKLGRWSYIGPFDSTDGKGFDTAYPPELEVNLDATYTGKHDEDLRWQEGAQFRDGEVNSLRIFEDNDHIAAYLHRVITADEDTALYGSFGSDDGIKVWINGQLVVSENAGRACQPDQNRAMLPLHRGENHLLIKITQGGGPSGFYFAVTGGGLALRPWHFIGPFDSTDAKGFDAAYPPEREINLDATYPGKNGENVRWQEGAQFRDGEVNSLRIFEDNDWIAVYLHRAIIARDDASLRVSFGSDDGIKVWLNRELLVANNVTRGCGPDQEHATLPLKKGANDLLIKITQGDGGSGFYFSLAGGQSVQDALLDSLLADFPDDRTQIMVETDWLRQDGLDVHRPRYSEAARRSLEGARALLDDLRADQPAEFLHAEAAALAALEREAESLEADSADDGPGRWRDTYLRARRLKRDIALSNPLLDFNKLLFVKRMPGRYSHMCDQYYGWHARPGGGLFILENLGGSFALRDVVGDRLPEGCFMHPDLSYDGERILFAYWKADQAEPEDRYYHIWEIGVDGSGLRRLTRGEFEDFSPRYLPGGDVIFMSTRRGGYGRCHGRPVPLYTLHRMRADGSAIRRLSQNEANEWDPCVMDDGRIVYSRWDYVDRHSVLFQSLWTCWPDGSQPFSIYGNATGNPTANYEPRQAPGTHRVFSTAAAHHSYTAGSIVSIDPWRDFDGMDPLTRLTPDAPFVEAEGWPAKNCYKTPFPLSDTYYLVSFSFKKIEHEGRLNPPNQHGLYLMDAFGNKELLYRDPQISSMSPTPLRPRRKPPILAPRWQAGRDEGEFLLIDVYRSMESVPHGAIKHLRIIQIPPKATPITNVPRMGLSHMENGKLVLGTAPVEADGSARFKAPVNKPLFFQALDERGKAVHSMRSLTYLQPGQTLSCVGCHEDRNMAPPVTRPIAAARPASTIEPGPDGSAPFSFPILVQPILDRHCIECHAGEEPEGGVTLTGALTDQFTRSYETLMNRPGLIHRWRGDNSIAVTEPFTFGAHASRLVKMLEEGHQDVDLSAGEWERIITWIDANALFYGTFIPEDQKKQQRGERIPPPALQ